MPMEGQPVRKDGKVTRNTSGQRLRFNASGECPGCCGGGGSGACCDVPGATCRVPIVDGSPQYTASWSMTGTVVVSPVTITAETMFPNRPSFTTPQVTSTFSASGSNVLTAAMHPIPGICETSAVWATANAGRRLIVDVDGFSTSVEEDTATGDGLRSGTLSHSIADKFGSGVFGHLLQYSPAPGPPWFSEANILSLGIDGGPNEKSAARVFGFPVFAGTPLTEGKMTFEFGAEAGYGWQFGDWIPGIAAPRRAIFPRIAESLGLSGVYGTYAIILDDVGNWMLSGLPTVAGESRTYSVTVTPKFSGLCLYGFDATVTVTTTWAAGIYTAYPDNAFGSGSTCGAITTTRTFELSVQINAVGCTGAPDLMMMSGLPPQRIPDDFNPAAEYRGCCDPPPIEGD